MGWGIYLYPQIYYSKVDFRSKYDVEREIESVKNIIKMLEDKLLALVMTTEPHKMMPQDEEWSPQEWLLSEYRQLMEDYEDSLKGYYYQLWKLELLYENWDSAHNENGKAIHPPKGSFKHWDTAYMDGDFIDSVYEDGSDPYGKEAMYEKLDKTRKELVDKGELIWSEDYKDWVKP